MKLNFKRNKKVKLSLVLYDLLICIFCSIIFIFLISNNGNVLNIISIVIILFSLLLFRLLLDIYSLIWRYGGVACYLRLLVADFLSFIFFYFINWALSLVSPIPRLPLLIILCIFSCDFILVLTIRLVYRFAYKNANYDSRLGKILCGLLKVFAGMDMSKRVNVNSKINIAIIGAGRTGVSLAEEITNNIYSGYRLVCFVDIDKSKVGREIYHVPVFNENQVDGSVLIEHDVEEIVFALPKISSKEKEQLFNKYKSLGYKIRVYDFPNMASFDENNKMTIRDFDIDELLFRDQTFKYDSNVFEYYKNKIIMITGGGGSIGSEIARQLAKMHPQLLLLVDIYENGAYDVQQELKNIYKDEITVKVEILSVTNRVYLEKLFKRYHIDIIIHAAAHKHVPLMERNAIEAISNNVFGTYTVADLAYQYKVERFIMVSTDKAVNPTNVMGTTKRMCEMIVQAYSTKKDNVTKFSATRFGNVLGSAGSVIPLFKKQIANGGPVTITDKRIVRYFMTIPEASSLVLESGYMAKNGELFVLDMGKPVKILELAENIIKLSGYRPYVDIDIKEVGLRPGEKLYEELLIKTESLDKTSNSLIFIEKDKPISITQMEEKLDILRDAINSNTNSLAREALKKVVPTYKSAEEVNAFADEAEEMKEGK